MKTYGITLLIVGICTLISFAIFPHIHAINLVMVYLLGTVIVATRGHRGPVVLSSILSVLCFDFFFVPPRFSFTVTDAEYLFTFLAMFAVAMIISHLTIRSRSHAQQVEAERLRNSLLSSISHDFRTPLTAIVGSASALLSQKEFKSNQQAVELLETIQEEAERLSRQIQNLLESTRIESGALQIKKELYPLEEVVGTALDRLKKTLLLRKIDVDIDPELPPVPMDGLLMEQVFINLLENAGRHTPRGTSISITAQSENGSVVIAVADQGPGLNVDEQERIFEKFYRHSASGGVGLGLPICRAIVNAHGGRIWAENLPAKHSGGQAGGAIFKIMLPLNPSK